jgi:hypothetical protein
MATKSKNKMTMHSVNQVNKMLKKGGKSKKPTPKMSKSQMRRMESLQGEKMIMKSKSSKTGKGGKKYC